MGTIRKENGRHRAAVFERDHGVCASCGVDTIRLWEWLQSIPMLRSDREWRYGAVMPDTKLAFRRVLGRHRFRAVVILGRIWGLTIHHHRKSLWEMNHRKSVAEGGGGCSLEQLETLCLRCHAAETAALAGRLARRPAKGIGRG